MDIAFCYESIIPARGGCEHYITDLAHYLTREGHAVHLYACRWDAAALPPTVHYHRIPAPTGPRFLRPWVFAAACAEALSRQQHDVSMGFDKTWGQDILYPQGGLHVASAHHNVLKYRPGISRAIASLIRMIDPAKRSFARLERKQYLEDSRSTIVVNSQMVRRHFEQYYDVDPSRIVVVPSAIDSNRFHAEDRLRIRDAERTAWGLTASDRVALFVAMNYRLKGIEPLLYAMSCFPESSPTRLAIVGNARFQKWERLAKSLGIADRVRFLGFRKDTRDAYFASDYLVHPTFYDPCSLVALEALACGLPVITSRYNGASELIESGREGFVIDDPHQYHLLADCMEQLENPKTLNDCISHARKASRRWSFDLHFGQLMQLFRRISESRRAA
jgi:UDP-glucose:(heptosyl)LPS alpha-1,3-glucosyltransferase